jgi:putative addiction module component (TIGR02574 family)
MAALLNQLGIDKLSVSDRLTLIDQIWESLDAEDGTFDVPPPPEGELSAALQKIRRSTFGENSASMLNS